MQYKQLEFDFVKRLKNKKDWSLESFSPTINWQEYEGDSGYMSEKDRWSSIGDIWKNVCDHIKIGFVFKWKF